MKKRIRNISLIGWLFSIAIFIGILAWLARIGGTFLQHDTLFKVLIGDILFGIIAFLALLVSLANSGNHIKVKEKETKAETPLYLHRPISPWFIVSMILLAIYIFQAGRTGSLFLNEKEIITPTPTGITDTEFINKLNNQTIPIISTAPQFIDSDPIITCNISAECGGGSRQMKQSECNNMICCRYWQQCGGPKFVTKSVCNTNNFCCVLKDGTGILVSSKNACDSYFSNSNGSSLTQQNYTLPTGTTINTNMVTPVVNNFDIQQALQKCIAEVNAAVDGYISRNCNNKEIYPSDSLRNGCIAGQEQQRLRSITHCHDIYPTN